MEEEQRNEIEHVDEKKVEPTLDKEQKLKKDLMEFYQEQIRKEDVELNKLKAKLKIHQAKKRRYSFERTKYSGKKPNKRKKDDNQSIPSGN